MKISDDRKAKLKLWIERPGPVPLPRVAEWPRFAKKSFRSHAEMNAWKKDFIMEIMRNGGVRWKNSSDVSTRPE